MLIENTEQVSTQTLYQVLQKENDVFLVDVRNEDEYESWKIETRHTPETVNIPYFEFFEHEEESISKIPKDRPIVVVCAKGGASDFVASMLEEEGIPASNIADGMIGWGNLHIFHPVVEEETFQIYQVDRIARGCLSYVLISDGKAVIIDPLRHVQYYEEFLERKDAKLELLLDTHGHADHISGGSELSKKTGVPYYMHPYDGIHPFDMLPAKLDYNMLYHHQEFDIGEFNIQVHHVPGHTLGQVNFLVKASDGSQYFFTGDNIFIQSFGRPDLGGQGEAWAPIVYETIFERVKENISEDALVLPGHYATPNEADPDGLFAKTLGDIWRENSDLSDTDREQFIKFVLNHLPEMPQQYVEIKRVNAGLSNPDEEEASELELGKNICALSTAY